MRKLHGLVFATMAASSATMAVAQWGTMLPTGQYVVDSATSKVVSRVKYLAVSNMKVHFPSVSGVLNYDARNPAAIRLDVNVDATKLDGGSDFNNGHLKGEDFFNTAVYPTIFFRGTRLMYTSPTTALVEGQMIVRGISKPSQLAVIFKKSAAAAAKEGRVSLAASTKIKRSDFGMSAWSGAVGENVTLDISVDFIRK